MASLFGLAPDGVYRAVRVATSAVSSYLAVSPLPVLPQSSRWLTPLLFLGDFAALASGKVEPSAVSFWLRHHLTIMPSAPKREPSSGGRHDLKVSLHRNSTPFRFLWHFPSPHGVRPLTGILLCGARTFLCISVLCSDCLASFKKKFNTQDAERSRGHASVICKLIPSPFQRFASSARAASVRGFCASQSFASVRRNWVPLKCACMGGSSTSLRLR